MKIIQDWCAFTENETFRQVKYRVISMVAVTIKEPVLPSGADAGVVMGHSSS